MLIGILSMTSYQVVLLSSSNGQTNLQLYAIGLVFFGASAMWYLPFHFKPLIWVFSLFWFFFSVAFLFIRLPAISTSLTPAHDIISNTATGAYTITSAAGCAYFGLNFGEEAGATTEVWVLFLCIIQDSQQIWVAVL